MILQQIIGGTKPPARESSPCLTTVNAKVHIFPNCDNCCFPNRGLRAMDKNYSIISFKVRAENLCGEPFEMEAVNTGATWNEAKGIISKVCIGSIIKFSCIKATDKNGNVQVLHPLTVQFKDKIASALPD